MSYKQCNRHFTYVIRFYADDSRVIETRGSLERVVEECGTLKYPARIKATLLRKFIATHIQVIDCNTWS